jgi:hypothetical protein
LAVDSSSTSTTLLQQRAIEGAHIMPLLNKLLRWPQESLLFVVDFARAVAGNSSIAHVFRDDNSAVTFLSHL